jgi:hypothetical protein
VEVDWWSVQQRVEIELLGVEVDWWSVQQRVEVELLGVGSRLVERVAEGRS